MRAPRESRLNDTLKATVESAIAENDSHLGRMRWARTALSGHLPLAEVFFLLYTTARQAGLDRLR
jgi:hypothetical protein